MDLRPIDAATALHPPSAWQTSIGDALRSRGLSNHAAALRLGVSQATLTSWLAGHTTPAVNKLHELAELTGLPVWSVYDVMGYLPEPYSPAAVAREAADRQRALFAEMQQWAARSFEVSSISPAARAIGILSQIDDGWELATRKNRKGLRFRISSNTLISLKGWDTGGVSSQGEVRQRIEKEAGSQLAALGLTWRSRPVIGESADPTRLWMELPDYERSRPAAVVTPFADIAEVIVCGPPYSHAELVAALIAEGLGYALVHSRAEFAMKYGLGITASPLDYGSVMNLELKTGNFRSPISAPTVYSFTYPGAFESQALEEVAIRSPRTHFVRIAPDDELLAIGAGVWGLAPSECQRVNAQVADAFERIAAPRKHLFDITLSELRIPANNPTLVHNSLTDTAVAVANAFLDKIDYPRHKRRGVTANFFP